MNSLSVCPQNLFGIDFWQDQAQAQRNGPMPEGWMIDGKASLDRSKRASNVFLSPSVATRVWNGLMFGLLSEH